MGLRIGGSPVAMLALLRGVWVVLCICEWRLMGVARPITKALLARYLFICWNEVLGLFIAVSHFVEGVRVKGAIRREVLFNLVVKRLNFYVFRGKDVLDLAFERCFQGGTEYASNLSIGFILVIEDWEWKIRPFIFSVYHFGGLCHFNSWASLSYKLFI